MENNKKQRYRPRHPQNGQNNWRNGNNNVVKSRGDNAVKHDEKAPGNAKARRTEAEKPIGYRTLDNLLKTTDNETELITKLSSKMNGFLLLLDQRSIRPDMMCLILAALAKASRSSTEQNTVQLLVHFYMEIIPKLDGDSNFYRELKLYIADLNRNIGICSADRLKHITTLDDLLTFLRHLQSTLYQKSYNAVRDFMEIITAQIEFLNRKGNLVNDSIVELMNQLNESVENVDQMKQKTEKNEVLMEPPQDFREISIYPDTYDILSNHEPFIRANVVNGKYAGGIDHYLDVQFRLLREDFVRPLRNGITQYRQIKSKPEAMKATKFRINDLNIYQNVQIYGSKMLHNEQVHFCLFDIKPFQHLRWQYNKRMMNGSLVCFSADDFETFFFATVAGMRDPAKLAKGEFQIKLEIESSAMPEITPSITYVMAESHVYFEAYRHNLKVLQDFGKDNFPLEKYIVNVDKTILPPSYLTNNSTYLISNGLPTEDPEAKISAVNVLGNQQWPPREDFKLDESQYEAFRAALTKQMVVIQGPPGTGKTYIGLRIVEVLLANTSQWPILIVCYTNHALDQFLEGILKFVDANDLVRIGGKSQCEALEKYNLSKIKSDMKSRREVPTFIHKGRFESNLRLKGIQEQISAIEKNIKHITDSVLGQELEDVIKKLNPRHYAQLSGLTRGRGLNEAILNWLGYAVKTGTDNQENGENNVDDEIDEAIELLDEMEMDDEEVKELEGQRLIDEGSEDEFEYDDEEMDVYSDGRDQFQEPINFNNIVPMDDEDADGFTTVRNPKAFKKMVKREITKSETMSEDQAKAVVNINALLPNNRWNLYRLWVKLYSQKFKTYINRLRDQYRIECLRFNGLRKQEDIEIVKKAKIIGMTTTGAAKYRHIIDGTKPKITIVEEAAEVLEAHIVTALCKRTDHLILIGDHLQLRPNPAVYELAKKFNLEVSLFERLINNEMDYYQLKQQHRMRPCISALLVPHIYKQLHDHPSVEQYEDVKGISKNMFFLNHGKNELTMQETRSHLNLYEAEFIVEMCRYIILQGYDKSQVTILTTYSGQLQQIRQLMRGHHLLSGVRATVVDNYQGEECEIILLSFVRSNEEGNIGFLKDSHRVNVALSRAKKGLYCIGNFDCLAEKSQLWQKLMNDLRAQGTVGESLEIYCQKHTDHKTLLNSKEGFSAAPEGGCELPCNHRLPCGHVCPSVCHIIDMAHVDMYKKCRKKCDKIVCEREHRCPKMCHDGEECGDCKAMVQKLRPECQHLVRVQCYDNPSSAFCHNPCQKYRSCGHKCKNVCGAICEIAKCTEKVEVESPCGHTVTVSCSDAKNSAMLLNACTQPCGVELKCGHLCKGSCGKCKLGRLHISCMEKCTKILICGHVCKGNCSVDCAPCKEKCTNSCRHSKCSYLCGYPCPPCMEKCTWRCDHLECSKLCSEPCDRELCIHPDSRLIRKCGHQSIGICGEKTPRLCRVCDKDEVETILFGAEDEEDARFIELEDCIKHCTIEVNGLINWIKTSSDSESSSSIQFKKCPKCSTTIKKTKSLNTYTQASLRDIQQVKLKTTGDPKANKILQDGLIERADAILQNTPMSNDMLILRSICADIFNFLGGNTKQSQNRFPKTHQTLIEQSNKIELVQRLMEIYSTYKKRPTQSAQNLSADVIQQFEKRLQMAASFIKAYKNCEQQRADISTEISFLPMMAEVIVKASSQPFNDKGKMLLNQAFETANRYGSATDNVRSAFKRLVNEAFTHSSGLGISMEEKAMILRTIGLGRGHWYKCRNGHIYAIGECGGAMQRGTCPECGSTIGGGSHRLDDGNSVASEMDGATAPAWPQ